MPQAVWSLQRSLAPSSNEVSMPGTGSNPLYLSTPPCESHPLEVLEASCIVILVPSTSTASAVTASSARKPGKSDESTPTCVLVGGISASF